MKKNAKKTYGIPSLSEPVRFRMDEDVLRKIHGLAIMNEENATDIYRRYMREGVERDLANHAAGYILPELRRAVSESMKPAEERLAALSAKTSITSATVQYLLLEVLGRLGQVDVKDMYEKARKKAVSFVKNRTISKDDSDE